MSTPVDAAAAVETAALKERVAALAAVTLTDAAAVCVKCKSDVTDCDGSCQKCAGCDEWYGEDESGSECYYCKDFYCGNGCEVLYLLRAENTDTFTCESCCDKGAAAILEVASLKAENAALKARVAALENERDENL